MFISPSQATHSTGHKNFISVLRIYKGATLRFLFNFGRTFLYTSPTTSTLVVPPFGRLKLLFSIFQNKLVVCVHMMNETQSRKMDLKDTGGFEPPSVLHAYFMT